MFTVFDTIHEHDGQTDIQTVGHRTSAQAALTHSIARQKCTGIVVMIFF